MWFFMPAFIKKKSAGQTYDLIKEAIVAMQKAIARQGWQVKLCPETTGKASQFGSLVELLNMKKETGCGITIDFSHLYARDQGKIDYDKVLAKLPKKFHAHFSGIEYGDKGERKHIRTTKAFFEPLARALIQHRVNITMINESPKPYEDAIMMKKLIQKLEKPI